MSKHTPGPWRLKSDMAHYDTLTTIEAGIVGSKRPFMPMMVVQVGGDSDVFEAEANARLIAYAPDLLALAEKIAHGEFNPVSWVKEARAAIAKARGQA